MRRTYGYLSAAFLFLLAIAVVWLIFAYKDPTRAQFDRVENGMTRQSVEELLGKPFHEERFGPNDWLSFQGDGAIGVVIVAPEQQLVVAKSWRPQGPMSNLELIQRWIRSE